jgi:hypothetical protein
MSEDRIRLPGEDERDDEVVEEAWARGAGDEDVR